MGSRVTIVRQGIAVLLIWAAYWAALPWLACVQGFMPFGFVSQNLGVALRACTFGLAPLPAFNREGYFINLVVAALYLAAGLWVAFRARFN